MNKQTDNRGGVGKMYLYGGEEFILTEELNNLVALVNTRTNRVEWVTKHILKTGFELKIPSSGESKSTMNKLNKGGVR